MILDNHTHPRLLRGKHDDLTVPRHRITVSTLPQGYGRAEARIGWRRWFIVVDQGGAPICGNVHNDTPLAACLRTAAAAAVRPAPYPRGPRP